ncbi:hypothetical protein [Candidatus Nephthysia bennettiae]|uniref:hypothetical protein n=1 Tax=Candidatus Nephthysia bennettiae TaxID=3127016 RepID=UPI0030C67989
MRQVQRVEELVRMALALEAPHPDGVEAEHVDVERQLAAAEGAGGPPVGSTLPDLEAESFEAIDDRVESLL